MSPGMNISMYVQCMYMLACVCVCVTDGLYVCMSICYVVRTKSMQAYYITITSSVISLSYLHQAMPPPDSCEFHMHTIDNKV